MYVYINKTLMVKNGIKILHVRLTVMRIYFILINNLSLTLPIKLLLHCVLHSNVCASIPHWANSV